jgi:chemotaxis protein CheD
MISLPSSVERANEHVLHVIQGSFKTSGDPQAVMMTILGSCVATCMWDPVARVGGMNHFLLASDPDHAEQGSRHGLNAMELLINGLLKRGAQRHRLKAKLFGGAMMDQRFGRIGKANAEFALAFLQNEGIPIAGQSLGGTTARRIRFSPVNGLAQQRLLLEQNILPIMPPPEIDNDIIFFKDTRDENNP